MKDEETVLKAYEIIKRFIYNNRLKIGCMSKILQDDYFYEKEDQVQDLIVDFMVRTPDNIEKLGGFLNLFIYRRLIDYNRKLERLKREPNRRELVSLDDYLARLDKDDK